MNEQSRNWKMINSGSKRKGIREVLSSGESVPKTIQVETRVLIFRLFVVSQALAFRSFIRLSPCPLPPESHIIKHKPSLSIIRYDGSSIPRVSIRTFQPFILPLLPLFSTRPIPFPPLDLNSRWFPIDPTRNNNNNNHIPFFLSLRFHLLPSAPSSLDPPLASHPPSLKPTTRSSPNEIRNPGM